LLERAIDTRATLEARPVLVRRLLHQLDAVGREVAGRYSAS
jgi:hypothetical protein